jgi:hypothetical protein
MLFWGHLQGIPCIALSLIIVTVDPEVALKVEILKDNPTKLLQKLFPDTTLAELPSLPHASPQWADVS